MTDLEAAFRCPGPLMTEDPLWKLFRQLPEPGSSHHAEMSLDDSFVVYGVGLVAEDEALYQSGR